VGTLGEALLSGVPVTAAAGQVIGALVMSPISTGVMLAMTAAVTHFWLIVLGGRHAPFGETLACAGYASAPTLFWIVPVLGVFTGAIWQLVVLIIAIARVQRTSALRAAIAVVAGPLTLVPAVLALRTVGVEAFKIASGGMRPTLEVQDHIFVNKSAYGWRIPFTSLRIFGSSPGYGDVAVFEFPGKPDEDYAKRVIALAGDVVLVEDGHPIINGWRVPSCRLGRYTFHEPGEPAPSTGELVVEFLGERTYLTLYEDDLSEGRQGPFAVSADEAFVLGDNRHNSHDSRSWSGGKGGGVPYKNVKGRGSIVWMSFAEDGSVNRGRLFLSLTGPPRLPSDAGPELRTALEKCLATRPPPSETTPPR
jgi:signal peptidase I